MIEKQTIKEIKALLNTITDDNDPQLENVLNDRRKGVQSALEAWRKNLQKQKLLLEKFEKMSVYEQAARSKGYKSIAGVDEVGRGPLAGPVVAASVILPENETIIGLNDSKQLSLKMRENLYDVIFEKASAIGVGVIEASEIDRINIYQASKSAMLQAIHDMSREADYLLIDAMELEIDLPQDKIIKGDSLSVSIAAASIIAKVTRDRMMKKYDHLYPGYDFSSNAGYGTKKHLEGLKKIGISPIHRHSFSPVKNYLSDV